MRCDLLNFNAHHTRLVKLFSFNFICPKITLREYFFYENLLDEIEANYGNQKMYRTDDCGGEPEQAYKAILCH